MHRQIPGIWPSSSACRLDLSWWQCSITQQAVQSRLAHRSSQLCFQPTQGRETFNRGWCSWQQQQLCQMPDLIKKTSVSLMRDLFQVMPILCSLVPNHFPKWRGTVHVPPVPNGSGATSFDQRISRITHMGRSVFLGVSHTLPLWGLNAQFWGFVLFMHTSFDAELPNLTW